MKVLFKGRFIESFLTDGVLQRERIEIFLYFSGKDKLTYRKEIDDNIYVFL